MMDAVLRLLKEGAGCCRFHNIITGEETAEGEDHVAVPDGVSDMNQFASDRLNASQIMAVNSCTAPLSLIWGPPGMSSKS